VRVLFFADRECVEGFAPLSDYTLPPALLYGGRLLAEYWAERIGAEGAGLALRGRLAESIQWTTGGRLAPASAGHGDLLLNSCASPFSEEVVSLVKGFSGIRGGAVYAGGRVVAAKIPGGADALFEAFTGLVEAELVYGNMAAFEEEEIAPQGVFLDPRSLLRALRGQEGGGGGVVEEGAVVRGRVYLGPGARVAPGAYVEDSVVEGDAVIEGRVRGSYVSKNTWVAGYVRDSILGLGTQVYPGSYVENSVTGVYTRVLPGAYLSGVRARHGDAVRGVEGLGDALEEYRRILYSRWGRLPSRFEEELLRGRQVSRRGRRP